MSLARLDTLPQEVAHWEAEVSRLETLYRVKGRPERKHSHLAKARRVLGSRPPHPDLAPRSDLPADTRLWAVLQEASGGIWAGGVYDSEMIARVLEGSESE